jgi:hypothetical protein
LFDVLHLSLKTNIAVIQCEIGKSAAKPTMAAGIEPARRSRRGAAIAGRRASTPDVPAA